MKAIIFLSLHLLLSVILCYDSSKLCGQLYPRLIGGPNGYTNATAIDMSADGGKIVIGGYTNESSVIIANKQWAFVSLFQGQLMGQKWHKIIQIQKSISTIKFSPDNKSLVFLTRDLDQFSTDSLHNETLIMLNNSNGAILAQSFIHAYNSAQIAVSYRLTENLIYVQHHREIINNMVIQGFSKQDSGSNFIQGIYFQSFDNQFDQQAMWIMESKIVDSSLYHPLIVMGTCTNFYYVMILEGKYGIHKGAAKFYTTETQIKKEGYVKASKKVGARELLIFNRYGRFCSLSWIYAGDLAYGCPPGILYSYLIIDQNGIFSKNDTYSFSGGSNFHLFEEYQNQDLMIINDKQFITVITSYGSQDFAYIALVDLQNLEATISQISYHINQFPMIYIQGIKFFDQYSFFTFTYISHDQLPSIVNGKQTQVFGIFKSQDYVSLDMAKIAFYEIISQINADISTPPSNLIGSINQDPDGNSDFWQLHSVTVNIADAIPQFSQIILENQNNGPAFRSSYVQSPNPFSFTIISGQEFQTQTSFDNFITKNCTPVDTLSLRYIGYNKSDNKQLSDSSLVKIDESGMITVSGIINYSVALRITVFGIYSNGLVAQLEYEFKILFGGALKETIQEIDTIFSSNQCPSYYIMQYPFTDQSQVTILEGNNQLAMPAQSFISFEKPNKIKIQPYSNISEQYLQFFIIASDSNMYQLFILYNVWVGTHASPKFIDNSPIASNNLWKIYEGSEVEEQIQLNKYVQDSDPSYAIDLKILNEDPHLFNYTINHIENLQIFQINVSSPQIDYVGQTNFKILFQLQDMRFCNGDVYSINIKYILRPRFENSSDEITEIHIGQSKTINFRPKDVNIPPSKI